MKYIVKMRKTYVHEYDFEVGDDLADNVVDAMDIAEDVMREGLGLGEKHFKVTETNWAPVSVTIKEESENKDE